MTQLIQNPLFALRTMYVFAHKQNFIALDPEIVVKIDKLLAVTDKELAEAQKAVEEKAHKDLEPWLEKYRLWKEMQQ